MEIPEYVMKKLEIIAKRNDMELEDVKKAYEKKFEAPFIKDDPQFSDDEERHQYCSGAFWSSYITKPKVEPKTIMPIGVSPIGKSKSSLPYCSVFALDTKEKLRRISFSGDPCFKTKNISYWNLYENVHLQPFKESNDLRADERAEFENPIQPGEVFDKKKIIDKLKIPLVSISEIHKHESRKDSTGYTDQTDWKAIKGFIKRESQTSYEEGDYGEWGRYTVAEGTFDNSLVSPEGEINQRAFSVRISPTLMDYPEDSQCYFLGPVGSFVSKKTNEKVYTMDCYCIIPIIVPPRSD